MSEVNSTTFVEIWNSCNSLSEVCERTGKSRRKAISLASSHRAGGKALKFFPRPGAKTALLGERFGRWTVTEILKGQKRLCRCDCGTLREVHAGSLTNGHSTGCYCTWKDRPINEDASTRKPEFSVWSGMLTRCYNPNVRDFKNYGGRGIKVCERWRESFRDFLADMGARPSPEHQIDRFPNNDGDYEPGNCRWATAEEQHNNTRANRVLTINGRSQTVAQWCREIRINAVIVYARLRKGWSPGAAVFTPIDPRKRNRYAHCE